MSKQARQVFRVILELDEGTTWTPNEIKDMLYEDDKGGYPWTVNSVTELTPLGFIDPVGSHNE
jgi:hypothetical protein